MVSASELAIMISSESICHAAEINLRNKRNPTGALFLFVCLLSQISLKLDAIVIVYSFDAVYPAYTFRHSEQTHTHTQIPYG